MHIYIYIYILQPFGQPGVLIYIGNRQLNNRQYMHDTIYRHKFGQLLFETL